MLAMGDSALRKEADAMTFVGCDLHTRTQQVAVLDTRTGEVSERQLGHDGQGGGRVLRRVAAAGDGRD